MIKPSVCVLMSTYNGEEFIRQQIDSILEQQGVYVHLFARDDGSSDGTRGILAEYEEKGKLVILDKESEENLGPAVSFMRMLYSVDDSYNYYAFADQDDIWKTEKIIKAVEKIENDEQEIPILYCSNQIIYRNGKEEGLRYQNNPNFSLTNLICGSPLGGCTMVMNRKLKEQLSAEQHRPSEDILALRMHDTWVASVALIFGKIIYDNRSYILYRQHDKNTVGIKLTLINRICKFLRLVFNYDLRNGRSKFAQEILLRYEVTGDNFEILDLFSRYRNGLKEKMKLLKNKIIKESCDENRFVFVAKVLANWV